ncbi:MAG: hypothetical protein LBU36_06345 [Clostridiales bacterium]|jgi:hypothetical protein|nr:hypothetical protein [Clostridiales bacterium]
MENDTVCQVNENAVSQENLQESVPEAAPARGKSPKPFIIGGLWALSVLGAVFATSLWWYKTAEYKLGYKIYNAESASLSKGRGYMNYDIVNYTYPFEKRSKLQIGPTKHSESVKRLEKAEQSEGISRAR